MPSFPGSTADNIELVRLDGTRPFTADQSMGTHKITSLSDGVLSTDAVNLSQLTAATAVSGDVTIVAGSGVANITTGVIVDTDINTTANITLSKLASVAGLSVLGRSPNTTGSLAAITATATGQVLRYSGTTLDFGALDLADSDAITGTLPAANMPAGSATSVFARASGTSGAMASLAATADGQFLQRAGGALVWAALSPGGLAGGTAVGQVLTNASGNVPTWGALDLSDSDGVTGLLPHANIANLTALSVLGRATNVTGVMAAITGADTQVLRVSGTTLGFGQIVGGGVADATLTLAKLANGTAASVLGRSVASGGVYADIVSTADGQVFRRSGGTVGWGAVDLADTDAVTGALPITNLGNLAALSVLGRAGGSVGAMAAITAASNGQALRMASGGLGFGAIDLASASSIQGLLPLINLTGGSAVGQVLRYAVGNVPAWGALDLADTDAITGLLPAANFAGGTAVGQVLRNTAGNVPAWGALDLADADAITGLLPLANLTGGSAVGQVLRNTAGNVPAWGALDLADTDAVDGRLSLGHLENGTTGRVLVAGASDPIWSTALGNTTDVFSIVGSNVSLNAVGTLSLEANSGTMLSAFYSGGRRVLGILGNATTSNMPAGTGDQVAFWKEVSDRPTSGTPVDGGIVWNDSTYGLQWKSPFNVETTIAPRGEGATTKRRLVDWKIVEIIGTVDTSQRTAASFDVSDFNGQALANGSIAVRGRAIAFGASTYAGFGELVAFFRVNAGVIVKTYSDRSGFEDTGGSSARIGIGIDAISFDFSGSVIRLRVTPHDAGMEIMSCIEVFAAEDA